MQVRHHVFELNETHVIM